jgi:hypothetical protein
MRVETSVERPSTRTITLNIITEQVLKAPATSVVHVRVQKDYTSYNCAITFSQYYHCKAIKISSEYRG